MRRDTLGREPERMLEAEGGAEHRAPLGEAIVDLSTLAVASFCFFVNFAIF
jgi:hypothetical protein